MSETGMTDGDRISEAIENVRKYVAARDAAPMLGLADAIHTIHFGSPLEASVSVTDLRLLLAQVCRNSR